MDENNKKKIDSAEFRKIFTGSICENHDVINNELYMDDQFLIELGKAIRSFELISWNLQQFIIVVNDGNFDTMLLSKLSFKNTVELVFKFSKIFKIYDDDQQSVLRREFRNAEEIRNLMIHSLLTGGKNKNDFITRHKLSSNHMGAYAENFLYEDLINVSNWFKKLFTVTENLVYSIRKIKTKK